MALRWTSTTSPARLTGRRLAGRLALLLTASWSAGCAEAPGTREDRAASAVAAPQAVTSSRTEHEIVALRAEVADLRSGIEAAASGRADLVGLIEQHQRDGQRLLDALKQELSAADQPADAPSDRPLEELALDADELFKQRAEAALRPALARDLELQKRLAAADAELAALRTALADKEQALAALVARSE